MRTLAVCMLAVTIAGCSSTVDKDVAEKLVKKVLDKEQIKAAEVSCPSGQPVKEGGSFDCTAVSTVLKIDLVIHVEQQKNPTSELYAEGAGGDYKLVARLDDSVVSRAQFQKAIGPGGDATKCPEVQKLAKVGDTAPCDAMKDGKKVRLIATREASGITFAPAK